MGRVLYLSPRRSTVGRGEHRVMRHAVHGRPGAAQPLE